MTPLTSQCDSRWVDGPTIAADRSAFFTPFGYAWWHSGTPQIMQWIASELGRETYVNLMDQYHPACRVSAAEYPEINRRITRSEFQEAVEAFHAAGLFRLDSDSVDFAWQTRMWRVLDDTIDQEKQPS